MYSDMSMRIIASWRVEHELGQRSRQLGLADAGRAEEQEGADRPVGSCRPARERRSALATALTASSWPITRSCSRSSMCTSFSISPSSSRDDRHPRPLRHDLGDVLGVDLLLEVPMPRRPGCLPAASVLACLRRPPSRLVSSGIVPYWSSAARPRSPARRACSSSTSRLLELLLKVGDRADRLLLLLPLGVHRRRALASPRPAPARAARGARRCRRRRTRARRATAARSPAAGCGGRPRRSRSAWSRSPCGSAPPPRRPGRSPCRAGSGRRCSGLTSVAAATSAESWIRTLWWTS